MTIGCGPWQRCAMPPHTHCLLRLLPPTLPLPVFLPPPAPPEAINFAMEEWLEAGKAAVPCTCTCLPDGVSLNMAIWCPELRESSGGWAVAGGFQCGG